MPVQYPNYTVVKAVLGCNIACTYCYVDHARGERTLKHKTIDIGLLEKYIREFQQLPTKRKQVHYSWHGGEPLLAGIDFYEEVVAIQKRYSQPGQQVRNTIQTNGILLDNQWIEFIKSNDFSVGLSIDGHPAIHDKHRVDHGGRGTSTRVMRGLNLLQQADVKFGTIVVVTEDTVGYEGELLSFLTSNGVTSFDFLPCFVFDREKRQAAPSTISPEKFGEFLTTMFDVWYESEPEVTIRTFRTVLARMAGKYYGYCIFSRDCSAYVSLDHDGSLWPCDNFLGYEQLIFGNVGQTSLIDICNSAKYVQFMEEINADRNLHHDCQQCEWLSVCQGGCPSTQFPQNEDFSGKEFFCQSRYALFEHIRDVVHSSADPELIATFDPRFVSLDKIQ